MTDSYFLFNNLTNCRCDRTDKDKSRIKGPSVCIDTIVVHLLICNNGEIYNFVISLNFLIFSLFASTTSKNKKKGESKQGRLENVAFY